MTKREEAIAAISQAILGRTCTVGAPAAFDAVMGVLMEPDGAMLDAARDWSVAKYGLGVGNEGASGCLQAMLKEAAK